MADQDLKRPRTFCGTSFVDLDDGSIALSCGKLMTAMADLLGKNIASSAYDTPMAADGMSRNRNPVSSDNPLVQEVPAARAILGLGLFITRGVRMDALFPALALSQYIVNHLTVRVWEALLRWAY